MAFLLMPGGLSGVAEMLDSGPIKGQLLDTAYVPKEGGTGKLWIHTDSSFSYVQKMESPGSVSISRECSGCKTRTYIYDPITEEITKEWETPYNNIPPNAELYYENGNMWLISSQTDDFDPLIEKYDAETGEKIMSTQEFLDQNKELNGGIIELTVDENPKRLDMLMGDGLQYIYAIEDDTLFGSKQEANEHYEKLQTGTSTVFALAEEDSDTRKKLYAITGPRVDVESGRCDSYVDEADTLEFFCEATAKLVTENIFLEAVIIYQDEDAAVILHQDKLGKGAVRYISSVDTDGNTKWSIPQQELFKEVAFNPDDSFSEIFFIQSKVKGDRSENIFIFYLDAVGLIGFDFETGAKLWELRP